MITKNEMHVASITDLRSEVEFTISFDNFDDFLKFANFYNRPYEVNWIEPVWSFGYDPIFKKGAEFYDPYNKE